MDATQRLWRSLAGGALVDAKAPKPRIAPGAGDPRSLPAGGLRALSNPQEQAETNACAAHSPSFALESYTRAETGAAIQLSRRHIWYNGRSVRGSQGQNVGMFHDDVARVLASRGVCPEDLFPWGNGKPVSLAPSQAAVSAGTKYLAPQQALRGGYQVAETLSGGKPVWFCFPVDDSYYTKTSRDGIVRPLSRSPYDLPWHSECAVLWDPNVEVGDYGPGGVGVIGSWVDYGLPHPQFNELHPYGFKWFPIAWFDDWDLVQYPYTPARPLHVEQ